MSRTEGTLGRTNHESIAYLWILFAVLLARPLLAAGERSYGERLGWGLKDRVVIFHKPLGGALDLAEAKRIWLSKEWIHPSFLP